MTAMYLARGSRQTLILTAIAGLHVGIFFLVASGLTPRMLKALAPDPPPIEVVLREKEVLVVLKPEAAAPIEPETVQVAEPIVPLPEFEERVIATDAERAVEAPARGSGPALGPAREYRPPALRTRDARLAALVNSCYPAASRRLGEEGRVVAHVVVGADSRARAWRVFRSSGFSRLDEAADCVVDRIDFVAGRRDGRPVEAEALLPIVFRLGQ